MSKKGVVDNYDIRVIEGFSLRFNVRHYLNSEFAILQQCIEDFKSNALIPYGLAMSISTKIKDLKNDIALLRVLELLREKKCEELFCLLESYYDVYEVIRKREELKYEINRNIYDDKCREQRE